MAIPTDDAVAQLIADDMAALYSLDEDQTATQKAAILPIVTRILDAVRAAEVSPAGSPAMEAGGDAVTGKGVLL